MTAALPEAPYLDYRVRWRAGASRPGKHPARNRGDGGDFLGHRPFWQLPDARRIDIRRTIIDPSGEVMVRQTEQRSSITLVLAADVSRSMQPETLRGNLLAIGQLAEAASRSTARAGDLFGFLAFDEHVREDLAQPPALGRAGGRETVAALGRSRPDGVGAGGLAELTAHLPSRRCLVLLVSDFLMPFAELEHALASLERHDLAPVVLHLDHAPALPRAGLMRLRDVETGRARLLLMRPSLHRRWHDAEMRRRDTLDRLFMRYGRAAFHVHGRLDMAALSEHLMDG